jgi:hypothetical protein
MSKRIRTEHPDEGQAEKQHDDNAVRRHKALHASGTALFCRQDPRYVSEVPIVWKLFSPDEADSSGSPAKDQAARQIGNWISCVHDHTKLVLVPQKSRLIPVAPNSCFSRTPVFRRRLHSAQNNSAYCPSE